MTQFKLNDANGIKSYVESLDIFNRFDAINVGLIAGEFDSNERIVKATISIEALDREVYSSTISREFFEPVFEFTKYFEEEITRLSASIQAVEELISLEHKIEKVEIENKELCIGVTVSTSDKSYKLQISIPDNEEPRVKIESNFMTVSNSIQALHRLENKECIKISQITSVAEELNRLESMYRKIESISLN